MFLGSITGVPTPACLSATSNPVEAVTPPFGAGTNNALGGAKNYKNYTPTSAMLKPRRLRAFADCYKTLRHKAKCCC
jgi:hypothetical protein